MDAFRETTRFKLETLAVPPETFFAGMPGVGRRWVSLMAEFSRAAVWVLPLRARAEGTVRDGSITFRLTGDDLTNLRQGLRQAAELMFAAGAREVVCPVCGLPDRLTQGLLGRIEKASDDPAAYPLAMSHLFGTARIAPVQRTAWWVRTFGSMAPTISM